MHSNFTVFTASSIETAKKPLAAKRENNAVRYNSGLAVVNPQHGQKLRKGSPTDHLWAHPRYALVCIVKYKIVLLCAPLKVMSENS